MSQLSPGTLLLAVIAVVAGAMGAYLVRESLQEPAAEEVAEEQAEVEYFTVPMASTDLAAGRKITLGDIAVYRLTSEQMTEMGVSKSYMNNTQQIIGRVLRDDLAKSATFSPGKLYPEGTGPDVSELLEKGKRAITVPVEFDSAVAGFASPGNWVDVVYRSDRSSSGREDDQPMVAITLIEKVKVLAMDEEVVQGSRSVMQRGDQRRAAVTLEVDPDQATALRLVDGRGTLALTLRHPDDEFATSDIEPLTMAELLNIPQPVKYELEVFRGNRVSKVGFESTGRESRVVSRIANADDVPETTVEASVTAPPAEISAEEQKQN